MRRDVLELRQFYASELGSAVRAMVERKLKEAWGDTHGQDLLALGYATPFIAPFRERSRRVVAAMPAQQQAGTVCVVLAIGQAAGAAIAQLGAGRHEIEQRAQREVIALAAGGVAAAVAGEELLRRLPVGGAGVGMFIERVQAPVGAEIGQLHGAQPRIDQHNSGFYKGYTYSRRPVVVVWSDYFDRITDGIAAERQIKGWSRAKKEALIRSD
eukprot:gene33098-55674_t